MKDIAWTNAVGSAAGGLARDGLLYVLGVGGNVFDDGAACELNC